MEWIVWTTLLLIGLIWLYTQQTRVRWATEPFADYFDSAAIAHQGPDGVEPDLAAVGQGPLLENVLTVKPHLSNFGANECALADASRALELGGQYVQRTNNYRRKYPDNCSAPLSEFVHSVYATGDLSGVGAVVPCNGQC